LEEDCYSFSETTKTNGSIDNPTISRDCFEE